ncbi:MAG: thioesterase family protein [Anaerolineales bacterium]|jgi:predicted thioesterase
MDLSEIITPHMHREDTFQVEEQHTAPHLGSGDVRVLATPAMTAFIERVSHQLIAEHLPEGATSVGAHMDVYHLAPTPQGETVRVMAEVAAVDKNRVQLSATIWDEHEKIGVANHQRVVIDPTRFMKRVNAKRNAG